MAFQRAVPKTPAERARNGGRRAFARRVSVATHHNRTTGVIRIIVTLSADLVELMSAPRVDLLFGSDDDEGHALIKPGVDLALYSPGPVSRQSTLQTQRFPDGFVPRKRPATPCKIISASPEGIVFELPDWFYEKKEAA